MARNKKNNIDNKNISVFIIMFIFSIITSFTLTNFYISFSSIDIFGNDKTIDGKNLNAEIINVDDIDADKIFEDTYYKALDLYSNISHGTTWLEICPNSQTIINDEIVFKVCDTTYPTKQSVIDSIKTLFTDNFINENINNDYIEYNKEFYIKPINKESNIRYVGMDSYEVKNIESNRVIYLVKSKYSDLNSTNYDYESNKFVLEYENGNWKVASIVMPF